jgi:hypothetical protein
VRNLGAKHEKNPSQTAGTLFFGLFIFSTFFPFSYFPVFFLYVCLFVLNIFKEYIFFNITLTKIARRSVQQTNTLLPLFICKCASASIF